MSLKEYSEKFLQSFNPDPDGIRQWVHVAKSMGAKYIVVTSKHCDGFRLWDTEILHPFENLHNF